MIQRLSKKEISGHFILSCVCLSMQEEEIGSTSFVTPGIAIRVERGGRTLFSYSKTLNRSSSRSGMNNARTRAFFEVEQDLEENFIGKFTAALIFFYLCYYYV